MNGRGRGERCGWVWRRRAEAGPKPRRQVWIRIGGGREGYIAVGRVAGTKGRVW